MATPATATILARPFRLGRLFLHFFDVHFIEEKGAIAKTKPFQTETRVASRLAVAVSEKVFVPAASYFESTNCRSVLDELRELFELGTIVITGSTPNLDIFLDEHRESAFYLPGSLQHQAYASAQADGELPPYISRTRSATFDIVRYWNSSVASDDLPVRLFRHQAVQSEVARRLEQVPAELHGRAFVPEHVFSVLDLGPQHQIVRHRIRTTINEAYFGSFTQDLRAGVIEDLNYLSTPYAIPSFSACVSFSRMVRFLRRHDRLRELLVCPAAKLLQLVEDPVWQRGLIDALVPPSVTIDRSLAGSSPLGSVLQEQAGGRGPTDEHPEELRRFPRLGPDYGLVFINTLEVIMGDQYKTGQAGAVGPGSHAHDMNFNQIWHEVGSTVNLDQLADDLARLRNALRSEANTAEHDHAIGQVANAEIAARSGDGPTALQHLAKAGKWVLDVATKIGTEVAVAAMKSGVGL